MQNPRIEFLPLRPAVRSDAPTDLDVLIKITPPEADRTVRRPPLNLGLVVDRSGSMQGEKIRHARAAAAFAIRELAATDRVSLTVFDDHVETLAPNAPVEDKARLETLVMGIEPNGGTALHGGWEEGARQVRVNLVAGGLNRVLLLSDGQANVGLSKPDAIADDVHRLAEAGVSTTTLGLGDDYNEDLMEAMAKSGDGNYYYIENPEQLANIFDAELRGLTATIGHSVTLGIEPCAGGIVTEVLNELERLPDGRLKLPNLVAGAPVVVLVRLRFPTIAHGNELCQFRLEWAAPRIVQRQTASASLHLPAVSSPLWETLAANVDVQEQAILLGLARLKKAATLRLQKGDAEAALRLIAEMKQILAAAPATQEIDRERAAIAELEQSLATRKWSKFHKQAKYQQYTRNRGTTRE